MAGSALVQSATSTATSLSRKACSTLAECNATRSLTLQLRHQSAVKSTKIVRPSPRSSATRAADHGSEIVTLLARGVVTAVPDFGSPIRSATEIGRASGRESVCQYG